MSARRGFPAAFLVLAILGIGAVVIGSGQDGREPPVRTTAMDDRFSDPRYFHPLSGRPDGLNPADASMQIKGVAAHRHVPVGEMRAAVDEFTVGRGREPLGRQYTDVLRLNQALDERWPIK